MSSRGDSPDSMLNDSDEREEDGEDSTDEDTEEASETDVGKGEEYMEIKEQMYQDKLAFLKKQLQQLKDGTHSEYNRKNKKLEADYKDRIALNNVNKTYLTEVLERNFRSEMKAAAKECDDKRMELKESLISEYEEKRRIIEMERTSLELISDTCESKQVMTRKLRRRPNDPLPAPEKRRKAPPVQINYLLEEKDIEMDLKTISRGRPITQTPVRRVPLPSSVGLPSTSTIDSGFEPRIEDGKLRYEKRFYHRGQPVYISEKDSPRIAANIHNIGLDAVWVKKVIDSCKVRIPLSHFVKKKVHIERRVP